MNRREMLSVLAGLSLTAESAAARPGPYPRSSDEIRLGVVPSDHAFRAGDVRRYGMARAAHPAVNAAALQKAMLVNEGGAPTVVPGTNAEYQLTGTVVAPGNTSIVLNEGAHLRWTEVRHGSARLMGALTRPAIDVRGDGFRLSGKGKLIGPSARNYVVNEFGILCVGRSASEPRRGLLIDGGVEISNWGSRGIMAQFVKDVRVTNTTIKGCGYAGMMFLSCQDGKILSNTVGEIGPGTAGNAYGISCSHDSRGYAQDPHAMSDGRYAANPFCSRFEVAGNTVYDVPVWTGIDFHGAYDSSAHDNRVYNCRNGVLLQGSSGDAIEFAGENNSVLNNEMTTSRMDGGPTTVNAINRIGISVNGGKIVRHRSVVVRGNMIEGYGDSRRTSYSIEHTFTTNVDIDGNHVSRWRGYGCYSAYSQGIIQRNEFAAVADPASTACIFVAIGGALRIIGNRQVVPRNEAALFGVYIDSRTDRSCVIRGNDFRSARRLPYAGQGGVRLPRDQMG